jgi:hypothetical protein
MAMAVRDDHEMPAGIGKFIHDHKYMLTLIEDQVFFLLFLFKFLAKETTSLLLF